MATKQQWFDALKAAGHTPVLEEDDEDFPDRTEAQRLDMFAISIGHCNGPVCAVCKWGVCCHCHPDPSIIPPCTGAK